MRVTFVGFLGVLAVILLLALVAKALWNGRSETGESDEQPIPPAQ
jgi:hypothetical protein